MEATGGEAERRRLVVSGADAATGRHEYKWVDLWSWPLRAIHWISVVAILFLAVTGFYIGRPVFMTGGEASSHYLMGTMRFLHFVGAGWFVAAAMVRTYLAFNGNRFERLPAILPTSGRDVTSFFKTVKAYLLVESEKAPHFLGHNPMAQTAYSFIYVVATFMIFSGFAMYGQSNPGGFFYTTFGWVANLMGGAQVVRFWHHTAAWLFVIYIPVHVYFSLRADVTEREGLISSMVTGGKFVRTDLEYEDLKRRKR
jgi:Ni/Fe-hydrogenase b-type cytochrome subunit